MQTNLQRCKEDQRLCGGEDQEKDYKGPQRNFGGYGHVHNLMVVMVSQVQTCVKTCKMAHLKYTQLIICQVYLNKAISKNSVWQIVGTQ